jgi:hypothetical protein
MSAEFKTGWLPAEDYHVLEQQFAEWGVPVPDPEMSSIAVAVDEDGELAGFWVLQTTIHAEPVHIAPKYRGEAGGEKKVWRVLAEKIQEPFQEGGGFYVFIPKDREDLVHMAREYGLEVLDWRVAKKEF